MLRRLEEHMMKKRQEGRFDDLDEKIHDTIIKTLVRLLDKEKKEHYINEMLRKLEKLLRKEAGRIKNIIFFPFMGASLLHCLNIKFPSFFAKKF